MPKFDVTIRIEADDIEAAVIHAQVAIDAGVNTDAFGENNYPDMRVEGAKRYIPPHELHVEFPEVSERLVEKYAAGYRGGWD